MASTELRAHSAYSFGDGAVTPEDLVARAAELGYTALGLTDTADLGGIVRFGAACRTHNVRPVVGAELIVDGRPLALLARTRQGYFHLASLVTRSRSGTLAERRIATPRSRAAAAHLVRRGGTHPRIAAAHRATVGNAGDAGARRTDARSHPAAP